MTRQQTTIDRAQAETTNRDPTQLVPQWVDTGMRVRIPFGDEVPVRNFLYASPGGACLIAGIYILLFGGSIALAAPLLGFGALLAAIGYRIARSTDYAVTTAADRVLGPLRFRRLQRRLPFTQEEAAEPAPTVSWWRRILPFTPDHQTRAHDVARILEGGLAEMNDGRLVGMVRLEGRNTDLQTDEEARPMIGRLRTALDEDVTDIPFRLYSTSLDTNPEDVTAAYRRAWHATYTGDAWRWMREYLRSLVGWESAATTDLWESREWRHYIVISVAPDDVDLPTFDESQAVDEERLAARRRRQQRAEVRDRLDTVGGAFRQTPGVKTTTVGPAELATIVARRWTGTTHEFDDTAVTSAVDAAVWPHASEPASKDDVATDAPHRPGAVTVHDGNQGATVAVTTVAPGSVPPGGDTSLGRRATPDGGTKTSATSRDRPVASSTQAYDNPDDDPELDSDESADASLFARVRDGLFETTDLDNESPNRIADLLAGVYDVGDGYVRAGEQYARTYWIAGWPTEPREKFLRELYTLRGVDVEVNLRCEPCSKDAAMARVKDRIGEVDADIAERKEASDVTAMLEERDMDPYTKMFILLHETPAQAWHLTGYVTVRAGTRQALDRAEEYLEDGLVNQSDLSLDVTKRQALEDASSRVQKILERSPAQLTPVSSPHRQDELFTAAGPLGRDAYAEGSHRERSAFTLSGTIAAAFPPVAPTVQQDDGVLVGRLSSNGSAVTPDPFAPGPAHQLVAGDSGSGKTTFVEKKALRWWAQGEDRTLILCDTMGEFAGITQLCNGERITLDGTQTINPLHIEATPDEVLQQLDVAPFEMKFQEAVNFILDVIANDPATADRFAPLVKDAVRETYRDAGVRPRDPSTHRGENSPTMADLRATVDDMGEHPSEYVTSTLEEEEIRNNAGPLLRRLSGFKQDGDLSALTGETETRIKPGGVSYLDLQQIEGLGAAADKSTMLMLMLGQVYQAVKRSKGPAVFVIDEAHYLLQSPEMLAWLQQAARHWRHYDAGLWFVSQHPDDFAVGKTDEIQEYLDAIRGQTTATTFFATEDLTDATAAKYGLNAPQAEFIRGRATRGEADVGYTDCLMAFEEREGWHHVEVRLPPLELLLVEYDPETHGEFEEYLEARWSARQRTNGGDHP
ncbi:VirB4 family type IV secretion system protein [Halomarina rubra]|uniref:VirB4 family type IV secretion system protein n=1 Tax=Halomarina rubra TaxID=2071873 RepID=A0ABD6AXM8_9EURY|nr:hypothetical protein [Halomarina rubra]